MWSVREEIAGKARGRVLEVGSGPGINFRHYKRARVVVAVDPDHYMLRLGEIAARESRIPIVLRQASAESLPFEDASFDTVVATLVLCSVEDLDQALQEMKRVLAPGGELRFYEHVRYRHAFGAFWQDAIAPVWRWFAGGCNPNRNTMRSILDAGFTILELEHLTPIPPIPPLSLVRPHIKGVAVRPD